VTTPDAGALDSHRESTPAALGHIAFYYPRLSSLSLEYTGFVDVRCGEDKPARSPLVLRLCAPEARRGPGAASVLGLWRWLARGVRFFVGRLFMGLYVDRLADRVEALGRALLRMDRPSGCSTTAHEPGPGHAAEG
jgi:hypothetical protein